MIKPGGEDVVVNVLTVVDSVVDMDVLCVIVLNVVGWVVDMVVVDLASMNVLNWGEFANSK